MSQRWWTSSFLLVVLAVAAPAAGDKEKDDNPFRTCKVGDFTGYKLITSANGKDIDGSMKITVIEKNEKTVKIKTFATFMGFDVPGEEDTIDLTKPFDTQSVINLGERGAKFEKSGEGTSKITVGGQQYDANWVTGKAVAQNGNRIIESEIKVWFSKSVPLSGVLRMETKRRSANVLLELLEHGNTK